MKKKRWLILTSILVMFFLLNACSKNTETEVVATLQNSNDQSDLSDKSQEQRTEQIFDTQSYADKLTIRYFFMDHEEKSGDSILVKTPDGATMLIDAGIPEMGSVVDQYLDQLNIDKIDVAIGTHPHYDHFGGYLTLFRTKQIGKVLIPNVPHSTNTYKEFISLIDEKQIPLEMPEDGYSFRLGNEVQVEIINPPKGTGPETLPEQVTTATINNHSLVLRMTYGEKVFLFTGDIYKDAEYRLVETSKEKLQADFLHAPHHGDETSSSTVFIEAVSPDITVLSSNIYQSLRVDNRYQKQGSKTYSTGLDGNLLIISDGEIIEVITEKER